MTHTFAHHPPGTSRFSAVMYSLLACGLMLVAREAVVLIYSGSIPFWDQWGGENSLFYPYLHHSLTLHQLIEPRNEHRILWTRLLTLLLFQLNAYQWDNALEAVVSNMVYCAAALVILFCTFRHASLKLAIPVALVVTLGGMLPYGWENALVGFQSVFYICSFLTLLSLALAAFGEPRPRTAIIILALLIASPFSMASGTFAAIAVAVVLYYRARIDNSLPFYFAYPLAWICSFIGIVGIATTTTPPEQEAFKAQGLHELLKSTFISLSWPLPAPAALVIWIPLFLFLLVTLQRYISQPLHSSAGAATSSSLAPLRNRLLATIPALRFPGATADSFFLGVALIGAIQALAVGYARGHGMLEVTSRYTDGTFFFIIGNAYFGLRFVQTAGSRRLLRLVSGGAVLVMVAGLFYQTVHQIRPMLERAYFTRFETINVARALGGDESAILGQPNAQIPYPDDVHFAKGLRRRSEWAFFPTSMLGLAPIQTLDLPHRPCLASKTGNGLATGDIACWDKTGSSASLHDGDIPTGLLSAAIMSVRQSIKWHGFPMATPQHPVSAKSSQCAIDIFNDAGTATGFLHAYREIPMRLDGWVKPPRRGIGPYRFKPLLVAFEGTNGTFVATAGWHWMLRPDVTQAFKSHRYDWSGFDAFVDVSAVPDGTYRILLAADGDPFCNSGHDVHITSANIPFAEF